MDTRLPSALRLAASPDVGRFRALSARGLRSLVLAFALAGAIAPGTQTAHAECGCGYREDLDILTMARSGVGSPYKWGGACWSTSNRSWGGADCSGFVVKAWQVPRASKITEDYHPYGTYHLFNHTTHWYSISRSYMRQSDLLGYSDPDGSGPLTGHVVMYHYGDRWGTAMVYEAPGSGQRIRHAWRDVSASKWKVRRRHQLIMTS